jgi:putative hydrolase of the HAD superfamily
MRLTNETSMIDETGLLRNDPIMNDTARSLVIFDLDNTLVDRERFFAAWAVEFIDGLGLDKAAALALIRRTDDDGRAPRSVFFARLHEAFGLRQSVETLVADYWTDQISRYRCEPETIQGLSLLRTLGHRLGIATNGGQRQVEKINACGLDRLVDGISVSDIVGHPKPDPRLFEALAATCGATLEGAWVVGDRADADIAGALAIGARSVWVSRGQTWAEPDFLPTFAASTVSEAIGIVAACA